VLPRAKADGSCTSFDLRLRQLCQFQPFFCPCRYHLLISERLYSPSAISQYYCYCSLRLCWCNCCWLNILLVKPVTQNFTSNTKDVSDHFWGPAQPPIEWVRRSFPEVERPGRKVDHSPPPSTELKELSYTSTTPIHLHSVDGGKFTFTLPVRCSFTSSVGEHLTIHKLKRNTKKSSYNKGDLLLVFLPVNQWPIPFLTSLPFFSSFYLLLSVAFIALSTYLSVSPFPPASFPLHCAPRHLDYVTSANMTQRDCPNTWNGWLHDCFLTPFNSVVKMEATCPALLLHGRRSKRKKADGWSGGMVLLILNRPDGRDL